MCKNARLLCTRRAGHRAGRRSLSMFTRAVPKNSKEKKKITMEKPWKYLWRAGPSRFDSSSTAEQVTEGIDATNLTAIVTGATNGIGKETARVLAQRGAKVIITARNLELGLRVKESLLRQNPSGNLDVMQLDLSSLNSVTSFARSFLGSNRPLNILINNAGILKGHFLLSVDGTELNFATNHLGHFVLTNLLLEKMKATAKETGREGRIVNVSSMAHAYTNKHGIQFDKINDPSKYKPFHAYGQSKLANILHANELSRRLREDGANVTANSLHPGSIKTEISRDMNFNAIETLVIALFSFWFKSIPQGAATTCYVALHPTIRGVTGKYFVDCNEKLPSSEARDEDMGKRLWQFSQDLFNKHNEQNA